jgi:hypothetical protein
MKKVSSLSTAINIFAIAHAVRWQEAVTLFETETLERAGIEPFSEAAMPRMTDWIRQDQVVIVSLLSTQIMWLKVIAILLGLIVWRWFW